MKIFLPPLDTRWRLLDDYATDPVFRNGDNSQTMTGDNWSSLWDAAMKDTSVGRPPQYNTVDYDAWNKRFDAFRQVRLDSYGFDGTIPSGTVLQIERYHVSRSGENQITVKVIASPSKFLTPKKLKGVMRGAGRLYFTLDQFNALPMLEEASDVII